MNHEPLIDEANNVSAFITNEEGYDVAVLERVHRTALPPMLTDAEWQSLINLINAAPVMLDALKACEAALATLRKNNRWDAHPEDFNDDVDEAVDAHEQARAAITKATK